MMLAQKQDNNITNKLKVKWAARRPKGDNGECENVTLEEMKTMMVKKVNN